MKELVYIASPYTHDDEEVMHRRYNIVTEYLVDVITTQGVAAYSPITYYHHLSKSYDLPTTWDYWENIDTTILSKADRMIVLTLDGWRESKGVTAEIAFAEERGIPITYVPLDEEEVTRPLYEYRVGVEQMGPCFKDEYLAEFTDIYEELLERKTGLRWVVYPSEDRGCLDNLSNPDEKAYEALNDEDLWNEALDKHAKLYPEAWEG